MDAIMDIITFLICLLHFYMFCRLVTRLFKKRVLVRDDLFYITSDPWEYEEYKSKEQHKEEGS